MICVRLEGGLGNQLFQYAAGRALAHQHRTELLLDTSTLLRRRRGVTARGFDLGNFKHLARIATVHESKLMPWMHRFSAISHWISPWKTYIEKDLSFNLRFSSLPDQTYLVGYWQSFKYFSDIAKLIFDELAPVGVLSYQSSLVEEKIRKTSSVAIHVRRGDYVSLPSAASFHGVLPLSYYNLAIRFISEKIGDCRFFIFSDDSNWCRENLNIGPDAVFVDHNDQAAAWQDLLLMSFCDHHVIANSSFSWWGAWMADQRTNSVGRYVIAPNHWFEVMTNSDVKDRFPSHWLNI